MGCETVSEAAKQAGVSRSTLCRWLNDSAFRRELREARGRVYALSMSRLVNLTSQAVSVLYDALAGNDVSKLQFGAAVKCLELAGQSRNDDVLSAMDEIREQLQALQEEDQ